MSEQAPSMTETEYAAFNVLFDATREVAGEQGKFRLVDPVDKVRHLFLDDEGARALVARLARYGLLSLAFQREGNSGEDLPGTYEVAAQRWLEFATTIRHVPDPPLAEEERALRKAIAAKRERLDELARRRQGLVEQLAAADAEIKNVERELKGAEGLRGDLAKVRERLAKFVNGAA